MLFLLARYFDTGGAAASTTAPGNMDSLRGECSLVTATLHLSLVKSYMHGGAYFVSLQMPYNVRGERVVSLAWHIRWVWMLHF